MKQKRMKEGNYKYITTIMKTGMKENNSLIQIVKKEYNKVQRNIKKKSKTKKQIKHNRQINQ